MKRPEVAHALHNVPACFSLKKPPCVCLNYLTGYHSKSTAYTVLIQESTIITNSLAPQARFSVCCQHFTWKITTGTRIIHWRLTDHIRGCLHDTGATFPVRVHSGSLLWFYIRLHDTSTKSHTGASHTACEFTPVTVPERDFRSGMKTRSDVM